MLPENLEMKVDRLLAENVGSLRRILDTLPLGVLITDREGVVIYYNQAHSVIDDLDAGLLLGKKENDLLFGPDIMSICHRTGRPILGFIYPYRTFRNKEVNGAYWVYPLHLNGRVEAAICFTQPLATAEEEYKIQVQWPEATPVAAREKKFIGKSQIFKKALNMARKAAKGPSPVLLVGATGTGKEMFARYIHQNSLSRDKPYLAVNCAAIPGALLEGLLFGTTKGCFTGAVDRAGLFEEANGGILYLDEIDSMPMELQPKLLRVLQETTVRRLGSSVERPLDLKIISSMGMNPQDAMAAGHLRTDLYYRLSVLTINIPLLSERPDDLEDLSNYFLSKYNALLNKQVLKLEDDLMELLRGYSWPGNIRELEHFLAGAMNLMSDEETILTFDHISDHYKSVLRGEEVGKPFIRLNTEQYNIPPNIQGLTPAPGSNVTGHFQAVRSEPASKLSRWQKEFERLSAALTATNGHVTKAAKILGITRQLLHYKMKKYGLDRHDFKNYP